MPFSKPIAEADYYTQFQTALFIAVEELGVKQAFLAEEVCGISPGYLSKLRGWNCHVVSKELTARRHMTNTNFKAYSAPLLNFLQKLPQSVWFENGMFIQKTGDAPKVWGALLTTETPLESESSLQKETEKVPELDSIEFPPEGQILIEWTFDFENDPLSKAKAIKLMEQLAEHSSNKVAIQVKLTTKAPSRLYHKNRRFQELPSPEDRLVFWNESPPRVNLPKQEPPFPVNNTPFFNITVDTVKSDNSSVRGMEHITIQDNRNDRLIEQFSDLPQWNEWHLKDDFELDSSDDLYPYLISHNTYGRQPFIVHAELEFQNYGRHADHPINNANAGFIIGWHYSNHKPVYYHLLLTGKKMLLERVGGETGDAHVDFVHLDKGVDFNIEDGVGYNFLLHISPGSLNVMVNHQQVYQVPLPEDITGQIGLRPWRSELTCKFFEVRELRAQ